MHNITLDKEKDIELKSFLFLKKKAFDMIEMNDECFVFEKLEKKGEN